MDPTLPSSRPSVWRFLGPVLLTVLFNPFVMAWIEKSGLIPPVTNRYCHRQDLMLYLPVCLDLIFLGTAVWMWKKDLNFRQLLRGSASYNLFLLFFLSLALLFSNTVLPGKFLVFRFMVVLVLLYLWINSFFLLVIKKSFRLIADRLYWQNLLLAIVAGMFVLLIVESVFMVVGRTHSFNNTLSSRIWYIRNWRLNNWGYRDRAYPGETTEKRKKILLLGDSFVAGHGIRNPEDRFGNILEKMLGDTAYRVFNMGVGGSDVKDAGKRLREFPVDPDILIFAYFPNDIELNCESAGFDSPRPRSYHDLNPLFRFWVRRSYLLNFLYWEYPHPDEVADFNVYLNSCVLNPEVVRLNRADLDSLFLPGIRKGIPSLLVSIPLLDAPEMSKAFTGMLKAYSMERGLPFLDVSELIRGKATSELVINHNDAHANEWLNLEMANAIYLRLIKEGMIGHDKQQKPIQE